MDQLSEGTNMNEQPLVLDDETKEAIRQWIALCLKLIEHKKHIKRNEYEKRNDQKENNLC